MTRRKPNRAVTSCTRKHRRPMPPAPRNRWDLPGDPEPAGFGEDAPLDLLLAVRRYGQGEAYRMLADGGLR